ncbi:hypothetical protein [Lacunimicrobium album]
MGTLLGCGVTAASKDAAAEMMRRVVFRGEPLPLIESFIEDVDLRELDANHVLPNMGDWTKVGIWYPLGSPPLAGEISD